jgi:acetate kinase
VARAAVADGLEWLGVRVKDASASDAIDADVEITATGAPVRTFVVNAREDLQLAAEAAALLTTG